MKLLPLIIMGAATGVEDAEFSSDRQIRQLHPASFIGLAPVDVDALYAAERNQVEHDHPAFTQLRRRPKNSPQTSTER
jgi:hypothetical protein